MKLLGLDPATVMGFCIGHAGSIPDSGSVRLKRPGEGPEVAAFNALCFLRDRFVFDKPDVVIIEHFLNPVAQKSADAVILQIMVFGVIVATCQAYAVRFESVPRGTLLKHFIGAGRTEDRKTTKTAVISRAKALGYLPRDCGDDNRADAVCCWSWGELNIARVQPKSLVLFGEVAS